MVSGVVVHRTTNIKVETGYYVTVNLVRKRERPELKKVDVSPLQPE